MFEVMLALGIRTGVIYRVSVDDGEVTPLYADEPGQFPDGIVVLDRQVFWTTMHFWSNARELMRARNAGLSNMSLTAAFDSMGS